MAKRKSKEYPIDYIPTIEKMTDLGIKLSTIEIKYREEWLTKTRYPNSKRAAGVREELDGLL